LEAYYQLHRSAHDAGMATNYNFEPTQPRQGTFCRNCGAAVTSAFCTHCGASTTPAFVPSMQFVDVPPWQTQPRAPKRARGIRRSELMIVVAAGALALLGTTVLLGHGPSAGSAPAAILAPTESPSPTASLLAMVTPAPTPTPRPTAIPEPTNTADDLKLTAAIKDGVAGILDRVNKAAGDTSIVGMTHDFRDLSVFASTELARLAIYTPSRCTAAAVDLYRKGLTQIESVADDFVAWIESGTYGPAPDSAAANQAGQTVGAALIALQASPC
jgi:hypothetical protein